MHRAYYEAYDDRYQQVHRENLKWFADQPSDIVSNVIRKYSVCGRILELGCGEGRDAVPLLEQGFDLLATDISPAAISFCQKEWPEYKSHFQMLDCVRGEMNAKFDFVYAVAVIHMLVLQEDRNSFYQFVRNHIEENGISLICTMGDGLLERESDVSKAFELQTRIHEQTGRVLNLAGTSYRAVSSDTFHRELRENGLEILEYGITDVEPDYGKMMYAVVRKS